MSRPGGVSTKEALLGSRGAGAQTLPLLKGFSDRSNYSWDPNGICSTRDAVSEWDLGWAERKGSGWRSSRSPPPRPPGSDSGSAVLCSRGTSGVSARPRPLPAPGELRASAWLEAPLACGLRRGDGGTAGCSDTRTLRRSSGGHRPFPNYPFKTLFR